MTFLLLAAVFVACDKESGQQSATPPEGAVNLGLSVFWAECNLGADDPVGYGDFYAWGELEDKEEYTWENYRFRTGGSGEEDVMLSKYNSAEKHGVVDQKLALDPEDDVARVRLGGKWRMPTIKEFQELIDSCEWTWTNKRGVLGYKVESRVNGNSIFLPSTGYRYKKGLHGEGYGGYYWSSVTHGSSSSKANRLFFNPNKKGPGLYYRCFGQPVRPVSE